MAKIIAFIAGRDPLSELSGGHSSYVRAHARAAAYAGYAPHIFCVAPHSEVTETGFGVIHRIASTVRPFRQLTVMRHARSIAAEVERFLRDRPRPDLIHSFGAWGYAGILAANRLRLQGRCCVTVLGSYTTYTDEFRSKVDSLSSSHGLLTGLRYNSELLWARLLVEGFEKQAYLKSDVVTVNYESVTRLIRARYGQSVNIVKLPYTSESAFLAEIFAGQSSPPIPQEPPSGGDDTLSIVTIARQEPNKGIHILLAAFEELRRAGIKFSACIIGGGPLLASHRRLARRLRLNDVVTMVGAVPDVSPYLQRANVYVLPSLGEGSGSLALIEAIQSGLAVVATGVDGIVEDVTDGENALLVNPGSPQELCVAISKLGMDPSLRLRLGTAARQRFVDKFSAEAFSKSLGKLYSSLSQERAAGRPPLP